MLSQAPTPCHPSSVELLSITVNCAWIEHPHKLPWDLVKVVEQSPIARACQGLFEQAFQRFMKEGLLVSPALATLFAGTWLKRKKAMDPLLDHISASLSALTTSSAISAQHEQIGQAQVRAKLVSLDASLFPYRKIRSTSRALPSAVHQDEDEDMHRTINCEADDESIEPFGLSSSPFFQPVQTLHDDSSELDFVSSSEDGAALFEDDIQALFDTDTDEEPIHARFKRRRYEDKPFYYA